MSLIANIQKPQEIPLEGDYIYSVNIDPYIKQITFYVRGLHFNRYIYPSEEDMKESISNLESRLNTGQWQVIRNFYSPQKRIYINLANVKHLYLFVRMENLFSSIDKFIISVEASEGYDDIWITFHESSMRKNQLSRQFYLFFEAAKKYCDIHKKNLSTGMVVDTSRKVESLKRKRIE